MGSMYTIIVFSVDVPTECPDRVSNDCLKPLAEACASICEDSDPNVDISLPLSAEALEGVVSNPIVRVGERH